MGTPLQVPIQVPPIQTSVQVRTEQKLPDATASLNPAKQAAPGCDLPPSLPGGGPPALPAHVGGDATHGVDLLQDPQLVRVLQQLIEVITRLVAALQARNGVELLKPTQGGGAAGTMMPQQPAATAQPQVSVAVAAKPVSYTISTPGGGKWTSDPGKYASEKAQLDAMVASGKATVQPNF